ncbi:Dennd1b [Phodopus roborovskii]|uniref:Dennd1b protein n=1 Tax=Phodopus roborovskii TaxID=109678 RepID=A0AAU9Z8W5_PHORO|nr:Dennd1b [Phodopus roborovskii]
MLQRVRELSLKLLMAHIHKFEVKLECLAQLHQNAFYLFIYLFFIFPTLRQFMIDVSGNIDVYCFTYGQSPASQNQVGQHFTFVLTDIESKQRFGFCRLTSGGSICLCILSYLPWFEVYYKLLNTLADYLAKELEDDLNETLKSLYNQPVPKANMPVNLSVHSCFIAPDITGLPTIPENRNLTEYFVAVDVNNMLRLYASMLHERRIIITSSKLSTLTACLHGSAALLYPMYWQHIYIPVLPPHLLDYCCAPMPYLIGIHSSLIERVKNKSLEDVVVLNVDTNTLESPFNDLSNLPSDVVSALKNKLKKQSTATGDGVARAFLRAQAALFGSYRDALRYKPGEPITFCEESFVRHRSSVMKQFLETAVDLQLFKQKGGALFNTAVTKATPAVRTAYKFAKSHARLGLREVKSKLKHKDNEEDYGTCSGLVQYTPIYTSHNEKGRHTEKHKLSQAHLRRPHKSLDGTLYDDDDDIERSSKVSSEDGEEASAYFYESDDSVEAGVKAPYSGEMDLLGEILDTLSTHSSDQGKLAAAKSLDFFRSMDDIDYKPTNKSNAPSENNLTLLGASGDQGEWSLGQDDSALHGKHLPPSPRKRVSSGVLADSLFILEEESSEKSLCAHSMHGPTAVGKPASPSGLASQSASPEVPQVSEGKAELKETLSQASGHLLPPSLGNRLSTFVPWEKAGREFKGPSEGGGLLQEVVALCHKPSDLQQGLNISQERSGSQT